MEQSSIHRWRQQSVPHSGVREALLAPMAAPALPDVVRSSSCVREEKEEELQPYHFHRQPTTDNRQPTTDLFLTPMATSRRGTAAQPYRVF